MSALAVLDSAAESSDISVRAWPNPFDDDEVIEARVAPGQTIVQIIGRADLPAIIIADGEIIECDQWHEVVPARELLIRRIPAGDSGRLIASIAVLAAAWWAAPYVVGGLASSGIAFGASFGGAVAITAGALTMAGNLLLNALIPPSAPDIAGAGSVTSLSALTGTSNQVGAFAPVPVLYGRMRYYPPMPMTALPYTELVGDDQYLRALFVLGYGPLQIAGASTADGLITESSSPSASSAIKIGDVALTQFSDVEYEIGTADQVTLYTGSVVEQAVGVALPQIGAAVTGVWVSDGNSVTRSTDPDTDEISLDLFAPALFSLNTENGLIRGATVEFKVEARKTSTSPISGWVTLTSAWSRYNTDRDPVRMGQRFVLPSRGTWEVRLTRTRTLLGKASESYTEFTWTVLRSIKRNRVAFDVDGTVVMAMRIRATNQLGGRLDRVSVEATRILPVWDTTVSPHAWVNQATRNPAWAYVDVLTGASTRNALPKSRVDVTAIKSWATWCDAQGLYCDLVIDAQGTVFDRARDVASAGLGSWHVADDGSVSIVRDEVQTASILISPRNSANFSADYTYSQPPHALRVQFIDPDIWEPTERLVYADGYDPASSPHTTPTRFEQLSLVGVTDADQAWKLARYHLAQLTLRPESWSWDQDVQSLIYQRGDSVEIANDVILVGLRYGRIKTINGGGTSATVDQYLEMQSTSPLTTYAVRIQRQDGSIVTRTITTVAPGTTSITFGSAVTGVNAGDHFVFGIYGSETIKGKISRIEPRGNFQARVTAVPAADDIFDAWTGSIPVYNPVITQPIDVGKIAPSMPTIVRVVADATSSTRDSDGGLRLRMAVGFSLPIGEVGSQIKARIRQKEIVTTVSPQLTIYSEWRYGWAVPSDVGVISIDNVEEGVTYQVQLQAARDTLLSDWTASTEYTVPSLGLTKYSTWYQSTEPTMAIVGDYWIDSDTNHLYRLTDATSPISWVLIRDTAIVDAQATADGKIVTFYQPSPPTAEGIGDLWFDTNDNNKPYRWSSTTSPWSWVSVRDATIAQAQADAAQALIDASDAQATADGKVVTFAQATPPTATAVGDLWIETDNKNKLWRWSNTTSPWSWVAVRDSTIADAQATADGKITTWYQNSPPTAEGDGDLWVDTNDEMKVYRWSTTTSPHQWQQLTKVLANRDQANTADLVDYAATYATSAFTESASSSLTYYSSGWTEIQSISFNCTGAPISLICSATFNVTVSGASGVYVRIMAAYASPQYSLWTSSTSEEIYISSSARVVVSFAVVHTPGAGGTVTYSLQATRPTSGYNGVQAINRTIIAIEHKK